MKFTLKEADDISHALNVWANWIETGNVLLSAQDAQNMKKPFKALNQEQMEKVVGLRNLAQRVSDVTYLLIMASDEILDNY